MPPAAPSIPRPSTTSQIASAPDAGSAPRGSWPALCGSLMLLAACSSPAEWVLYETDPAGTELGRPSIPEAADLWGEWLSSATESVELAHMYASEGPDAPTRLTPVISALEAAAARGVRVRFLTSERFYATYPALLDRWEALDGIEVRRLDLNPINGGILHAKFMIVDGERVASGSHNFDWRSLEQILELGFAADSTRLAAAWSDLFESDWALAGDEDPPAPTTSAAAFPVRLGNTEVSPAFSPIGLLRDPGYWDLPQLVAAIDSAVSDVSLQALTVKPFTGRGGPLTELNDALERAAARGVRVRVLTSHWNTSSRSIDDLRELSRVGHEVRVLELPVGPQGFVPFSHVSHSKLISVDGGRWAWVGSSNLERSYFQQSRNGGWILEGGRAPREVHQSFERAWNSRWTAPFYAEGSYPEPRVAE